MDVSSPKVDDKVGVGVEVTIGSEVGLEAPSVSDPGVVEAATRLGSCVVSTDEGPVAKCVPTIDIEVVGDVAEDANVDEAPTDVAV